MTKLLTFGILFSTAVNAKLVAYPVILGILFCISVTLAFKSVFFLARSLVLGIFFSPSLNVFPRPDLSVSYLVFKTNLVVSILSTFVTNLFYSVFSRTSFFTTLLNLAKSLGTGFNFAMSNLSTSVFILGRFVFDAKLLTSTSVTFFRSVFVA